MPNFLKKKGTFFKQFKDTVFERLQKELLPLYEINPKDLMLYDNRFEGGYEERFKSAQTVLYVDISSSIIGIRASGDFLLPNQIEFSLALYAHRKNTEKPSIEEFDLSDLLFDAAFILSKEPLKTDSFWVSILSFGEIQRVPLNERSQVVMRLGDIRFSKAFCESR